MSPIKKINLEKAFDTLTAEERLIFSPILPHEEANFENFCALNSVNKNPRAFDIMALFKQFRLMSRTARKNQYRDQLYRDLFRIETRHENKYIKTLGTLERLASLRSSDFGFFIHKRTPSPIKIPTSAYGVGSYLNEVAVAKMLSETRRNQSVYDDVLQRAAGLRSKSDNVILQHYVVRRNEQDEGVNEVAVKLRRGVKESVDELLVHKPILAVRSKAAPKLKVKAAAKLKAKAAPKLKVKAAPKLKAKAAPKLKVKAAPKLKAKAAPKLKVKAAPKLKAKAAPKLKVKAAPKLKAKAAPKLKAKAAQKLKVKAEAAPEIEVKAAPVIEEAVAAPQRKSLARTPRVSAKAVKTRKPRVMKATSDSTEENRITNLKNIFSPDTEHSTLEEWQNAEEDSLFYGQIHDNATNIADEYADTYETTVHSHAE
ncbi:hypothetical protein ADEAN_000954400 [Angomonas deanei]|uniref:Uncharacterized protein n=1 Tax=Angomonas deanei TaxID=59799 RepID=A0A7G2CR87_9TRYP|nr:hypothetical protein ADEAN_000954400 [Angomonas deanei]